jgi:hypothetical protein
VTSHHCQSCEFKTLFNGDYIHALNAPLHPPLITVRVRAPQEGVVSIIVSTIICPACDYLSATTPRNTTLVHHALTSAAINAITNLLNGLYAFAEVNI